MFKSMERSLEQHTQQTSKTKKEKKGTTKRNELEEDHDREKELVPKGAKPIRTNTKRN